MPRSPIVRLLAPSFVLAFAAGCSSSGSSPSGGGGGGKETCRLDPAAASMPYPAGPCSVVGEVGETIANYRFEGRIGGISAPYKPFHLGDFYDPTGKTKRLMVVTVSALWCTACKLEAPELRGLNDKYGPKGVVFFTDLAQDGQRKTAAPEHVDAWIKAYSLEGVVGTDKDFALQSYFDPSSMPLNLIVDLTNMKIVAKFTGASLPQIKAELEKRVGPA